MVKNRDDTKKRPKLINVRKILADARAVRAQVKRELTDEEIAQFKSEGRMLETARRFRSTLTFEATDEEISEAKRHGRL